jgi:hypothetical protein
MDFEEKKIQSVYTRKIKNSFSMAKNKTSIEHKAKRNKKCGTDKTVKFFQS